MQSLKDHKPMSVNMDVDETQLEVNESPYLKNYRLTFNKNVGLSSYTGTDIGNGANMKVGTPLTSNMAVADYLMPSGRNKCIGTYESQETNEMYYFNWNSNSYHGIYRINGKDNSIQLVYLGAELNFNPDPKYVIASHRVSLTVIYDADEFGNRKIKFKILKFVDGLNSHRWIDVEASIATSSFDATDFPYYKLFAPHFDKTEFIDWAPRPPMYCPSVSASPVQTDDAGKVNFLLNKSVQFAYRYIFTDGRTSVLSPTSTNYYLDSGGCFIDISSLPRCVDLKLYAGSALVEKIQILFKSCSGEWYLYDTIDKYKVCEETNPEEIQDQYWLRRNQWSDFQYDTNTNTIIYRYCGNKECAIFSQEEANRIQNDIPIQSFALTPAGDSILLGNNLYGRDNFGCDNIDPIVLETKLASEVSEDVPQGCPIKNVRIRVYAQIANTSNEDRFDGQFIFKHTQVGETYSRFGGYIPFLPGSGGQSVIGPELSEFYDFKLPDGNDGFLGYLAGTPYTSISRQYLADSDLNLTFTGPYQIGNNAQKTLGVAYYPNYYQVFDFVVPAGKYIFRIADHHAKTSDQNYAGTSAYVKGTYRAVGHSGVFENQRVAFDKEFVIDACNGDVDYWQDVAKDVLLIYTPPTYGEATEESSRYRLVSGYLREDNVSKVPIEGVIHESNHGTGGSKSTNCKTDHNGFFFEYARRGGAWEMNVKFRSTTRCGSSMDILATTAVGGKVSGYFPDQNVYMKDAMQGIYPKTDRIIVKGRITDCDGAPVQGLSVSITHGQSAVTLADGTYAIIVHAGHACGFNGSKSPRKERLFINAQGDCQFSACDCSCAPEMEFDENQVPCNPNDITTDRVFIVPDVKISPSSSNTTSNGSSVRGLKGGGNYGVGIVGYDIEGRPGFVNIIDYVEIPSFLSNGGKFEPSLITWSKSGPLNLPSWVKYASFYVTKNLAADFYIQWLGDKFEMLDRYGAVTEEITQGVRAQITIQSLLDFNEFHNQKTTTAYQFVKGDVLRLYDNGDGTLFDTASNNGYLDYLIQDSKDGNKVILNLDDKLKTLIGKCGFWFEIYRPKQCIGNQNYYEVCGIMPVRGGEIMDSSGVNELTSGVLNVWDTYYQKRIFIISACSNIKTVGHPFEHSSISDFWGEGCASFGRTNVQNPNATQRWFSDDVIKSDALVAEGGVNGLATFRAANRKAFKGQEWGGIIAMHAERNLIFYVCQNDWFTTSYDLNYARVTEQGMIQVNNNTALGDPYQKIGQNFGCEYEEAATIICDAGAISWVDSKNAAVILSNMQEAVDISLIDNKSYFVNKLKYIAEYNNSLDEDERVAKLIEIVSGKDPLHNELHFTFRYRAEFSDENCRFINDLRQPRVDYQETFVYNVDMKKWNMFVGYTPEFYGMLRHSVNGVEMITMAAGMPYEHNNRKTGTYNVFYGVSTQQVVEIVENFDPIKTKIFQSVSIDSKESSYFIDRILTDDPNSFSYIPGSYVVKKEGTWYAEFLRNMNTYPDPNHPVKSQLVDGKRIFGKFAKIRFVKEWAEQAEYNELNNIIIRFIGSERSES